MRRIECEAIDRAAGRETLIEHLCESHLRTLGRIGLTAQNILGLPRYVLRTIHATCMIREGAATET